MSTSHTSPATLRSVALPQREASARDTSELAASRVFSLTVLVLPLANGETCARAANLHMAEIQAGSVRGALSQMVAAAKTLIGECLSLDKPIPWIDPPRTPAEAESQFLVPLHL